MIIKESIRRTRSAPPKQVRDVEYFKKMLRENPALPPPKELDDLSFSEQVWERKSANRCYDAARIELGIKTAQQIQDECRSFSYPAGFRPRVVRYNFS